MIYDKDARPWGLQVVAIAATGHRMERYTPRNLDIAKAMIEIHKHLHGPGWTYKIEDWTPGSTFETIWIG